MAKKSKAKMYPFREDDKILFKDVVFLVEATHNEQHHFWVDYHYKPRYEHSTVKKWEQVTIGRMIQIGELDNRPINISINWAILEGYIVMFYEGVSQLVDHKMIEDWIQHFSLDTIRWDNGHRWAHTDSGNFHHCLNAIQDLVKEKGVGNADPRSRHFG